MRLAVPALVLAALVASVPASAQQGNRGIAFVNAPEQSAGVCSGDNPDRAFACARKKCVEGGAAAEDCARMAWCYPAGWSAFMGIRTSDFSFPTVICGAPSRRALEATARAWCQETRGAEECSIGEMWTPEGRSIEASWSFAPKR